jgi:mono/diheme cytochrome c family protein
MKPWTLKHGMILGMCLVALSGCHWDMWDQDRYEPLEGGDFFGEGETSSRTLVAGVVPYKAPRLDDHLYAGRDENGELVSELPASVPLTKANLERGRERYQIYCTPCHGSDGEATGMITKRGFPQPPSYVDQRLLEAPVGYFYDVMTNGFGRMYSYATRISVEDRWRIAAYVKTLQLSQNALPEMLTEEILEKAKNPPAYVHPDDAVHEVSHDAGEEGGGHDEDSHDGGEEAEHDDTEETTEHH